MKRTLAKETINKTGKKVSLQGWVDSRRDHGKIVFLDLRDRSGMVQCVVSDPRLVKQISHVRAEWVVEIIGTVKKRPANMVNPELETGKIEVEVNEIKILAESRELPLPIDTDGYEIDEEVRLKYRYLDLRRPRMARTIKLRSKFLQYTREYLFKHDFVEIETPILTKSTPEGSRDFIVPSRMYPGKFFALPQSPQQYKQLLMVAGFERYFQMAKCIRDEDPRADRGFEHSQIDIEMSFVERKDIMAMTEGLMIEVFERLGAEILKKPFPVFTYKEALEKFGADKFDMRSKKEKEKNLQAFAWVTDFPFFERDSEDKWTFTHNPFSQPISEEHTRWLLEKKNIGKIITSQYDLVCNGLEVGGGSIRSHKPEVLSAVFEILGYSKEDIQKKFGHMLEAFRYGAPPHGGIAPGIERLLMTYLGENVIREVQTFPQTGTGRTSIMDAPSGVEKIQLEELGIKVDR